MESSMPAKAGPQSFRDIWRASWLGMVYSFSDINLQKQQWLDPTNTNPHWSYIEFICSYFDDLGLREGYDEIVERGFVSRKEVDAVRPLHSALDQHTASDVDNFDNDQILADPAWQTIIEKRVKRELTFLN